MMLSSGNDEVLPMEKEDHTAESLQDLPSNETEATDMDWSKVEVDDVAAAVTPQSQIPPFQHDDKHCSDDDFSFGSSNDGEGCADEKVFEKFASVTLDTSFNMNILQQTIKASKDALDLVEGKDVVMIIGKTGVGKNLLCSRMCLLYNSC